jgi:5-methylthioribose kinase
MPVSVRELGGGVSNVVLLVELGDGDRWVLKQSRAQLRTELAWFSRLDRIWAETTALRLLDSLLPPGTVPSVLFEDRANYLFAMTCAPEGAEPWKARLLRGAPDHDRAKAAGTILGSIHTRTLGDAVLDRPPLNDRTVFDQLRIDPYYRQIARSHVDMTPQVSALIEGLDDPVETTFVHADFSPKNMLTHAGGFMIVDFETAHAGDPAFDLGFFLSHLILKAFREARRMSDVAPALGRIDAFWTGYLEVTGGHINDARASRGAMHAAACCLARVDGKSPVDYLRELDQDAVRRFAGDALMADSPDWSSLMELVRRELA